MKHNFKTKILIEELKACLSSSIKTMFKVMFFFHFCSPISPMSYETVALCILFCVDCCLEENSMDTSNSNLGTLLCFH